MNSCFENFLRFFGDKKTEIEVQKQFLILELLFPAENLVTALSKRS